MKLVAEVMSAGQLASPKAPVGATVEPTLHGRLGAVDDMAGAVAFLCSDASRSITGVGLLVDGGMDL